MSIKTELTQSTKGDLFNKVEELEEGDVQGLHWKKIIFLPFDTLWELIILVTVTVTVCQAVFHLAFWKLRPDNSQETLFYTLEVVYAFDTCLYVLHHIFRRERRLRDNLTKSRTYLTLDILSLLPIDLIYRTLVINKTGDPAWLHDALRMRVLLRSYRIPQYFYEKSYQASRNQIITIICGHFVLMLVLNHMVSCLWYALSCYQCEKRTWAIYLDRIIDFNYTRTSHWYWISFATIFSGNTHNWRLDILPENMQEHVVLGVTILVGFLMHFMVLFGRLVSAFMKMNRRQFYTVDNIRRVKHFLDRWGVSEPLREKTLDYYNALWIHRYGLRKTPTIFFILPSSMQREVKMDICWEALKHSHLFKDEDLPFKRALSMKMESEFLLPGDHIYTQNMDKRKMIYLVSGVVQIFTHEDDESPVLSFSSGTCFGEMSLLLKTPSIVRCRCATYCEVQTLDLVALFHVLRDFPGKSVSMRRILLARLEEARKILDLVARSTKVIKVSPFNDVLHKEPSVVWLKKRWRTIHSADIAITASTATNLEHDLLAETTAENTSRYLDLFVLSRDVELKMKFVFVRTKYPFIFEPASSFIRGWTCLNTLTVLLTSIIYPYYIAFARAIPLSVLRVCLYCDFIFFLDIYIQCSTAIKRRGHIIAKFTEILTANLMDKYFLIDLFATIPFNYLLCFYQHNDAHLDALIASNRLLKILKVFLCISNVETQVSFNINTIQNCKYVLIYSLSIYWISCILYMMACFLPECQPDSWLAISEKFYEMRSIEIAPTLSSLYYAMSSFIGLGLTLIYPRVLRDVIALIVVSNIGYYVFSCCFSEFCAMTIFRNHSRTQFHALVRAITQFLTAHQVPLAIRSRIYHFMTHQWEENEAFDMLSTRHVLSDATDTLREKILVQQIYACIARIPLFQGLNYTILHQIATNARVFVLPASATLMREGIRTSSLYYIYRGFCSMHSRLPGDKDNGKLNIIGPGSYFPVIDLLHEIPVMVTVHTVSTCHVITIDYKMIKMAMQMFPAFQDEVSKTLAQHASDFNHIFQAGQKVVQLQRVEENVEFVEMFRYVYREDGGNNAETHSQVTLSSLRHMLFSSTIDNTSKFMLCWEWFRCFLALVSAVVFPTFFGILKTYESWYLLRYFLDMMGILDIFLRFHLSYHNSQGIFVTDLTSTRMRYLTHAFALDLFTIFPFDWWNLDLLFGEDNQILSRSLMFSFSRCLQLYRLFGLMVYYQGDIRNRQSIYNIIRGIVLVLVCLNAFANNQLLIVCGKQPHKMDTKCNLLRGNERYTALAWTFYHLTARFTSTSTGLIVIFNKRQLVFTLMQFIGCTIGRLLMFGQMISDRVEGNVNLTLFQEQTKSFLQFAESEVLSESLIHTTITHFEYIWRRTKGNDVSLAFSKQHMALHEDVVNFLYGDCLKLVPVFQSADSGFIRLVASTVREVYIRKGAEIIRTNDVQDTMYIVYRGSLMVRIITDISVAQLEPGSMFGCFDPLHPMRHTMEVVALQHTDLLALKSSEFFQLLETAPQIQARLNEIMALNPEFIEASPQTAEKVANVDAAAAATTTTTTTTTAKSKTSRFNAKVAKRGGIFQKLCRETHVMISEEESWYSWWQILIHVVAPFVSMIVLSLHIALGVDNYVVQSFIYGLDVIYISKIYLGFQTMYIDEKTGTMVMDLYTISRRYICSLTRFWMDLFGILPLEIIAFTWKTSWSPFLMLYLKLNRIVRLVYFIDYYNKCSQMLTVGLRLRWVYLVFSLVLSLHMACCVWMRYTCEDNKCYYLTKNGTSTDLVKLDDQLGSLVLTYLFTVNMFSGAGLYQVKPTNEFEGLLAATISLFFQVTLIVMTSNMACLLFISNHTMAEYEIKIVNLRHYLEDRDLSPALVRKVWQYLLQVWQRQRGEWMPQMITKAPLYLKQNLMEELYGHHLLNNFMFEKTHMHFLRQLVTRLERCVFFPGNYIVEKGDVDQCMYFIHSGEVEVLEKEGMDETIVDVLMINEQFGFRQGLHGVPHTFYMRARTVVDILILHRRNWDDLYNAFPASRETILQKSEEAGPDYAYSQRLRQSVDEVLCY